jgi:RNA polymerase sigma-70 factor, ECF subfamily
VSAAPLDRERLERDIRRRCGTGDKKAAATLLLEGYGQELFGFLVARLRDRDAASEVFSQFTEDLWRGLDGFRWQSSARVWSYTLLRHAASRYVKDARKRRGRQVPLSRAGPLSAIAERIRTTTLTSSKTETRSRITQLRERLPESDQMLILLRVNRKLDWKEIAQVLSRHGPDASEETIVREAARLRKRFELSKKKLKQMAVEQGLIASKGED